ncbi:hypothetical protein UFOVP37_30 [uncultured Caudovirales phage]|uniref:Uncharacterized protein n=1 Tax=uncultured Caudovirales phage TaxID=2100421 RepID=A0A6J5KMJ2_9CAUD|nr:hypothetical protein UFOVP37_30 [uncultured Caudovirales phage]
MDEFQTGPQQMTAPQNMGEMQGMQEPRIDKQTIMSLAANNPQVSQAADIIEARIANMPGITEKMVDELVATLEYVLQNPQEYPKVREAAIRAGFGSERDFPAEFDPTLIVSMLVALYEVQTRYQSGASQAFARGGLAQAAQRLASAGRGGDTMLAHINPREASMLARMGGSGTVNPTTGLVEFKGKIGKLIAAVAPVVLSIVAPGIGTAIGSALGASGIGASMLGSAVIGGASSAAAGGNALTGALGGALGAGGASALGGAVNSTLGTSLGQTAQNVVGSTLAGAAQGALSGQGATQGALQGALGGYAGSTLSNAASGVGGQLGAGLQAAGTQVGNALTMGATPTQALAQGALTGLAAGLNAPPAKSLYDITPSDTGGLGLKSPSDIAVDGLKAPAMNTASVPEMGMSTNYGLTGDQTPTFKGPETMAVDYSLTAPTTQTTSAQPELGTGIQQSPLNAIADQTAAAMPSSTKTDTGANNKMGVSGLSTAANMLPLLSLFSAAQTPEQVQQVVAQMTPEQQAYFNRPMRTWNWDTLSAAAKMQGLPVGSYIARNWDKVGGGMYDNPTPTQTLARGGALTRLASGGGSGRDDTIPARLSDGEYVMDAETVSMLGDGSTKDGARRLDEMRAKIREHKGKSMARGKFSANAKSPLAYLKGA